MQIIPVMDLSENHVVHAVKGERKNYKPVHSRICSSSFPLDVIDGFLDIDNFKTIYIADLDALENRGNHKDLIHSICKKHPSIMFWLDCGIDSIDYYMHEVHIKNLRLILSSESIPSVSAFTSLITTYSKKDFILSLDFKADKFLGSDKLLSEKKYWPEEIIILNLDRVGINNGFTFPTFFQENELHEKFKMYIGGGIRDTNDIQLMSELGVKGVLISSALHSQSITRNDLEKFSQSL